MLQRLTTTIIAVGPATTTSTSSTTATRGREEQSAPLHQTMARSTPALVPTSSTTTRRRRPPASLQAALKRMTYSAPRQLARHRPARTAPCLPPPSSAQSCTSRFRSLSTKWDAGSARCPTSTSRPPHSSSRRQSSCPHAQRSGNIISIVITSRTLIYSIMTPRQKRTSCHFVRLMTINQPHPQRINIYCITYRSHSH